MLMYLEALGYKIDLSNPTFPNKSVLNKKTQALRVRLDSKKMIGVAPFAAHEGKMYPLDLMKEVIEAACKRLQDYIIWRRKKGN